MHLVSLRICSGSPSVFDEVIEDANDACDWSVEETSVLVIIASAVMASVRFGVLRYAHRHGYEQGHVSCTN
jgi:hypothetical protein